MRKHRIIVLLGLLIFMGLASCSTDDVDTEQPVIQLIEPADHAHFHPGDDIHFDAEFSDNVALKQFKIDIHLGDGHDHKSGQHDDHEWSFEYIGDLEGRSQRVQMQIPIPENAKHGEYHFLVFCTDEAGNESFIAIEIEIDDDDHGH